MNEPQRIAEYNRTTFSRDEYRRLLDVGYLDFHPALHAGDMAPDFVVSDLDGRQVRLSDYRDKKHVAFELGCITAPVFVNDIPEINRIYRRFRDKDIELMIIYVREGHPAERYTAHTSLDQKIAYARELRRLEAIECPVMVDSLAGEVHHLYGLRPSPVWVVNKEGRIVHKSTWLVAQQLEMVLDSLLQAEQRAREQRRPRWVYSENWTELGINPQVHERVLDRAGAKARHEVSQAFGQDPVRQG